MAPEGMAYTLLALCLAYVIGRSKGYNDRQDEIDAARYTHSALERIRSDIRRQKATNQE